MNSFRLVTFLFILWIQGVILPSCSTNSKVSKQAMKLLLEDSFIQAAHIGISIYEPATRKYWYTHDADKYFVPASNTKLFSLYAGMKYLGDSLVGLRYEEKDGRVILFPTGDPTFLHPDFHQQPVLDFLKTKKEIYLSNSLRQDFRFHGRGWAWDDYMDYYMTQRNPFPLYGNIIIAKWISADSIQIYPRYFYQESQVLDKMPTGFKGIKSFDNNQLTFTNGSEKVREIPFRPDANTIQNLLEDILHVKIKYDNSAGPGLAANKKIINSQPSDSLFKKMMFRSDNFYAEQVLLMASNEKLGYLNQDSVIAHLFREELKDINQQPQWVDGSGLSRYNLFTPGDFIYILDKLKKEFPWERIRNILLTGGQGTLKNYYQAEAGFIFAKTGTLNNNCALSGYLVTRKNKFLIFSIIVNNYQSGATPIRRQIEKFLKSLRENY